MGKFEKLLLCTDLDGTLLNEKKKISEKNKKAINYFMENGGKFTFVTGRAPDGAKIIIDEIKPNINYYGCFNGGGIFDFKKNKVINYKKLENGYMDLVKYIEKDFPSVGIEFISAQNIYFMKENSFTEKHRSNEKFIPLKKKYNEIKEDICKILLADSPENLDKLSNNIEKKAGKDFYFIRSDKLYYEIMPVGVSKGNNLIDIANLENIKIENTIAVGDNNNDISMIEKAGIGIAVKNASDAAKKAAKYITVSNEEDAIHKIIMDLEDGKIKK